MSLVGAPVSFPSQLDIEHLFNQRIFNHELVLRVLGMYVRSVAELNGYFYLVILTRPESASGVPDAQPSIRLHTYHSPMEGR